MIEELRSSLIFSTPFSESRAIKLVFSKGNLSKIYESLVYSKTLEENLDEAQTRFVYNLRHISQLLRDYLKEEKSVKKAIQELVNKIFDLEFIVIECKNESDVYQIFEGLNSTGLELSVVDLVKNAVFRRIDDTDRISLETAEKIWEKMENDFENTKLILFSKFIRHQWISKYGYINNSQLYDAIRDKLKDMKASESVINFIQELQSDASLYLSLRVPNIEFIRNIVLSGQRDAEIEKYLCAFDLLDSDQIFEVLLAYCRKFILNRDTYTKKQFLGDLQRLWNLGLMIKIVASVNPSKYEQKFADRCKEFADEKRKDFNQSSNRFYKDLWGLVKDRKEEFVINFNDLLVYKPGNDKNNEFIRFVLLAIYQQKNQGVTYEIKTVEHILSQSRYILEPFLHHIGNLTILSRENNSVGGDKDFVVKYKNHYSKDIFDHNKNLNKYPFDLDPEKATSWRARDLGEEAFEVFALK